ncbi:Uncharacterised protein [Bordetella pertussis]|nr:Uncharacterised protein [Bordetella pertussis]CPM78121.1 Uncharacterised protein [Bordetella pertussis]CPN85034.1 Uncharacterised protein [Bordetella pertussis]
MKVQLFRLGLASASASYLPVGAQMLRLRARCWVSEKW